MIDGEIDNVIDFGNIADPLVFAWSKFHFISYRTSGPAYFAIFARRGLRSR